VDPLVDATGQAFSYANDDPANGSDPSGQDSEAINPAEEAGGPANLEGAERNLGYGDIEDVNVDLGYPATNGLPNDVPNAYNSCAADQFPSLSTPAEQLESKFKHAADFGVLTPRGAAGFDEFGKALNTFVEAPDTVRVEGLYQNEPAILNYDPDTSQVVVQRPDGQFWTGWKLSPRQLSNVIFRGSLGGH
jgi:hypothetical protein